MEALAHACAHCGNDIEFSSLVEAKSGQYCCQGCRIVRENLLANGLEEFYTLRNTPLAPVGEGSLRKERFGYLDDPDFQNAKFQAVNGGLTVRWYIEGARCQACLWILESIPERLPFVKSVRFSLGKNTLDAVVEQGCELSLLPELIQSYGYVPHLVFENSKAVELKRAEKRKELRRLGVAFACAGNIMLLSASAYAGLEGVLREWFDLASLVLCVPSVTYCSLPFYRSTLGVFRSKNFSIDVSVAVGILFGFVVSAWAVLTGLGGDVYFDTIAMLVFLLLGSRYLLDAARERGMDASEMKSFFTNTSAKKIMGDGKLKEVHSSLLEVGDEIIVEAGETVPVDSIILKGTSYFNESALTGESYPRRKGKGESIFGGAENQSIRIRAKVEKTMEDSEVGQILERLQGNWGKRTSLARLSDSFSKVLVISVSVLAAAVFVYFHINGQTHTGLQRALAMIVITCPCALGFNIPISMMIGMKKFAKAGIMLKDDNVVEKVGRVETVFLDKTGTVTSGQRRIELIWSVAPELEALLALESRSKHPIARSLMELYPDCPDLPSVECFSDVPGKGPKGKIGGSLYEIAPSREQGFSFSLLKEGLVIMNACMGDEMDKNFSSTVAKLKEAGKKVCLLSGDKKERVLAACDASGGEIDQAFWERSPADKEEIVSRTPNALMFGDGVNDALALKSASVGVAANGGVDLALSSSEVYFCSGGPELLVKLVDGCSRILSLVKANVMLAIAYNLVFVVLATLGKITPFAAAVLMPLSSLILLATSLLKLRGFEKALEKA